MVEAHAAAIVTEQPQNNKGSILSAAYRVITGCKALIVTLAMANAIPTETASRGLCAGTVIEAAI
jgi:hypothetical protein